MSERLVRLTDHRGQPVHIDPNAVVSVAPSIIGDGFSAVVMTHGDARTVSGDPDAVTAMMRGPQTADTDILREMREVLAHIRREDRDALDVVAIEQGFRLLATRLGLEWKP